MNYIIQTPVVRKDAESYQDIWNTRASCLTDLKTMQDARDTDNADITGKN